MKRFVLILVLFWSQFGFSQTLSLEKVDAFALQILLQLGLAEDLDLEQPPRVALLESYFVTEKGENLDLSGLTLLYSFNGHSLFLGEYQYLMFYLPANGGSPAVWFANVDSQLFLTGYGLDQMSVFLEQSEQIEEKAQELIQEIASQEILIGPYNFFDQIGMLWFEDLFPQDAFDLYRFLVGEKHLEVALAPFWTQQVLEMGPLKPIQSSLICMEQYRDFTKDTEFLEIEEPRRRPGEESLPTLLEFLSVDEPCPNL